MGASGLIKQALAGRFYSADDQICGGPAGKRVMR